MPRKKTLADTLRAEMKLQKISANELARRIEAGSPLTYKSARRKVRRLLKETTAVTPETAAQLDKAFRTVGVFAQFIHVEQPRGTRAALSNQIADYLSEQRRQREDIDDLRRRVERLERAS